MENTNNGLSEALTIDLFTSSNSDLAAAVLAAQAVTGQTVYLPNFREMFHVLKHDKREVGDTTLPLGRFLTYAKEIASGATVYDALNPFFLEKKVVALRGVPLYMDFGLRLDGGADGRPVCSTVGAETPGGRWANPYPFGRFIYAPARELENGSVEPDRQLTGADFVPMGSRGFSCLECVKNKEYTAVMQKGESVSCKGRGRFVMAVFEMGILEEQPATDSEGLVSVAQQLVWYNSSDFEGHGFTWPFIVVMETPAGVLYDSAKRTIEQTIRSLPYLPADLQSFKSIVNSVRSSGKVDFRRINIEAYPDHPEVNIYNVMLEFYAAPFSSAAPPQLTNFHRYFPLFRYANPVDLAARVEDYVQTAWLYYHFMLTNYSERKKSGMVQPWTVKAPQKVVQQTPDTKNLMIKLTGRQS